jgi:hypothetical protein
MRTDLGEEEQKAAERMAQLTGICPRCGDGGFWIDNSGFHWCQCLAGIKAQEEDTDE